MKISEWLPAWVFIKIPILALLCFGFWGMGASQGGFMEWLREWQSLIGAFAGSLLAVILFQYQRHLDKVAERKRYTTALAHELHKIIRKIERVKPWRVPVHGGFIIMFHTRETAILKLQQNIEPHLGSLAEFHHELIDYLDSIPRTSPDNIGLIAEVDKTTTEIARALNAIEWVKGTITASRQGEKDIDLEKTEQQLHLINSCTGHVRRLHMNFKNQT